MPVRSLNSRVFTWPKREEVIDALGAWAARQFASRPELLRVGYFGSLAHGTWGFGSDADLVAVVRESRRPMMERPIDWDTSGIPVPVDLLVYTDDEFTRISSEPSRFGEEMRGVEWLARS